MTVPPQMEIQPLGDSLLLRGQVLVELEDHLRRGVAMLFVADSERETARIHHLLKLLRSMTSATSADGNDHQTELPELIPGVRIQEVSTAEAAALLDVSPRQVRNLRDRLGGRKVGGTWTFDLAAVETELQLRRGAA